MYQVGEGGRIISCTRQEEEEGWGDIFQDLVNIVTVRGVSYFPKGIFSRATSQVTISQWQVFNFPCGDFLKDRLGPLRCHKLQQGRALRLGQGKIRGRSDFGSCNLGNYPWEIAAWEKSYGKYKSSNQVGGAVVLNLQILMYRNFMIICYFQFWLARMPQRNGIQGWEMWIRSQIEIIIQTVSEQGTVPLPFLILVHCFIFKYSG